MQRDTDALGSYLADRGLDGFLIDAPGSDPDQRYLSGFGGNDPFRSLFLDEEVHLLVRGLDRGLAQRTSRAQSVSIPSDFDYGDLVEEYGSHEADVRTVARFLTHHDVSSVAVPPRFPVAMGDALRTHEIGVEPDRDGVIARMRAVKSPDEVTRIRRAQRATERAMGRAEAILTEATVAGEELVHAGETLTSERVKEEIEVSLIQQGHFLEETIVASGTDAADPHDRGTGPIRPNEPIVIDVFPHGRESRYHADMTRTFCVGQPTERAQDWYDLTVRAQEAAFDAIEPGASSTVVHDAACDVYEDAGIPTTRTDPGSDVGFTHGTGHGVGLSLHERPRVSTSGEDLQPGHVITIEPGIYDPSEGGIRIEDLVVVTEDGYENLTNYPREFVP